MNRLVAASAALGILATIAGCGSSEADRAARATAQQVADRYAKLLATASSRSVSDAEIDAAGIDRSTTQIRPWVDYFTCEIAGELDWADAATQGRARLTDVKQVSPTQLSVRASIFVVHPTDGYTPGDEHVLGVELRDGRWVIATDRIINEWAGRPGAEGPTSDDPESSTETDHPSPCSYPEPVEE